MKGLILAGGKGTRLSPATTVTSKQLLPIYDKPMIFYSLSVLMLTGISDIGLISGPDSLGDYKKLLGNGSQFGVNITYIVQPKPEGIAQAFHVSEEFVGSSDVCLILGDNLFVGRGLNQILRRVRANMLGASVFLSSVSDPSSFGVAELSSSNKIVGIEEKPRQPKSSLAVTGLYFYKNDVIEKSRLISPSERGEYEISDINKLYLDENRLSHEILGRGFAWLDTGTPEGMLEASTFVSVLQNRQNIQIGSLEEIALNNSWITKQDLKDYLRDKGASLYYNYLRKLIGSV